MLNGGVGASAELNATFKLPSLTKADSDPQEKLTVPRFEKLRILSQIYKARNSYTVPRSKIRNVSIKIRTGIFKVIIFVNVWPKKILNNMKNCIFKRKNGLMFST